MAKSKEEVIAELYALRAGLSMVSQKADEIRDYEKDLAELDKNVKNGGQFIENCEQEYQRKLEECEEYKKNIYIEAVSKACDKIGYVYDTIKTFLYFMIIPGIISIIMFTLVRTSLAILAGSLFIGIPLLILIIILATRPARRKKWTKQYQSDYQEELQKMQEEAREYKETLDKSKAEMNNTIAETEPTRQSCLQVIADKEDEFKIYDKALVKQYDKFISVRDWQNIDLLIFYLETGRADDMKEALQQADRQRQTNAIVREIRRANESIRYEINSGFAKMGTAMGMCFSELSRQFSVQHTEMIAAMGQNSEKVSGALKDATKQIVSATELNNALQAKANVTSDQLKYDLEFMQHRMGMRN